MRCSKQGQHKELAVRGVYYPTHLQPVAALLLRVVAAVHQARRHDVRRRGVVLHVVNLSGVAVQPPPNHTLHDFVIRHLRQADSVRHVGTGAHRQSRAGNGSIRRAAHPAAGICLGECWPAPGLLPGMQPGGSCERTRGSGEVVQCGARGGAGAKHKLQSGGAPVQEPALLRNLRLRKLILHHGDNNLQRCESLTCKRRS